MTEAEKKNRDIARKVYGTPEGRALLADLLNDLGFFKEDNEGKVLLRKLGVWKDHNIMRIVNALMDMPYAEEIEKGED